MKPDHLRALPLQSDYRTTANACAQSGCVHQTLFGSLGGASGGATSARASGEIPEIPPPYALQCDPWRQSRRWVSFHSRLVDLVAVRRIVAASRKSAAVGSLEIARPPLLCAVCRPTLAGVSFALSPCRPLRSYHC